MIPRLDYDEAAVALCTILSVALLTLICIA
jgi:hypothetical protein